MRISLLGGFGGRLAAAHRKTPRRHPGQPRPTLVTCRSGPRSSALVYLYCGLRSGASADEVLGAAEADGAPFVQMEPLRQWVVQGLTELSQRWLPPAC